MPTTPAAVTEMLERLPSYRESLGLKEVRRLPELLEPGEAIRALTHGFADGGEWLVVVTDRRVFMVDDDLFGDGYRFHALDLARVHGWACTSISAARKSSSRRLVGPIA